MYCVLVLIVIVVFFIWDLIFEVFRLLIKGVVELCLVDGICGFCWDRGEYDGDVFNGLVG